MNRFLFVICWILFAFSSNSQTLTLYYKDYALKKKTTPEKANYMLIKERKPDGKLLTELRDLADSTTIYKLDDNGEAWGIWTTYRGNKSVKLDFEFTIDYKEKLCTSGNILMLKDFFQEDDSMHYTPPVIATGEVDLGTFLSKQIIYPSYARENDITGQVILQFVLTDEMNIENITVIKGVHPSLDKEAVRVMRNLKLLTPPKLNGNPTSFCITLPIRFLLD